MRVVLHFVPFRPYVQLLHDYIHVQHHSIAIRFRQHFSYRTERFCSVGLEEFHEQLLVDYHASLNEVR